MRKGKDPDPGGTKTCGPVRELVPLPCPKTNFFIQHPDGFLRISDFFVLNGIGGFLTLSVFTVKPGFRIRTHLMRIRIHHFRLNTDPDPIRIQGFMTKN
jgi:hypothetical protein